MVHCVKSTCQTKTSTSVKLTLHSRISYSHRLTNCLLAGHRSDNFIVGLTNNHPAVHAPALWKYTLCGQYPGAVPNGATVSVQCTDVYEQALRFRYVIVQFPSINEPLNVCEIQVFTVGTIACTLSKAYYKIQNNNFQHSVNSYA